MVSDVLSIYQAGGLGEDIKGAVDPLCVSGLWLLQQNSKL